MLDELVDQYLKSDAKITNHDRAAITGFAKFIHRSGSLDFRNMSSNDVSDLFSSYNSSSERVMRNYFHALEKFLDWMKDQGIDVEETSKNLHPFFVARQRQSLSFQKEWYYGSYQSMLEEFKVFADRTQLGDKDKFAAYLTLAWFGVPRSEALQIKEEQITEYKDMFIVDGLVRIKNPNAVYALRSYLHSDGFYAPNGKFYKKKISEYYFRGSSSIQRDLARACEKKVCEHCFSYDEVAQSALFAKTYDALRALEIKVTAKTYLTHSRIVCSLLNIAEYAYVNGLVILEYVTFYEWCKVFRQVDDLAPSD